MNLDDTPALLILAVAWLNYDAFSWANPEVLPDWVFSYGLNYIDWEANNALVSIYGGAILAVPFLEVECFFVLFILTVLVSFIQDPKRRTRTGTAFTV